MRARCMWWIQEAVGKSDLIEMWSRCREWVGVNCYSTCPEVHMCRNLAVTYFWLIFGGDNQFRKKVERLLHLIS